MEYLRGASADWDRYANVTGDQGWSWDSLQPYILKVCKPCASFFYVINLACLQNERFGPSADGHNLTGEYDPSVHSTTGMVDVSLPGFPTPIDPIVVQATQEQSEFPFVLDMNSGNELGIGEYMESTTFFIA